MEYLYTALYLLPALLFGMLLGFWFGYRSGSRAMVKAIHDAFGVPEGSHIVAVQFAKNKEK